MLSAESSEMPASLPTSMRRDQPDLELVHPGGSPASAAEVVAIAPPLWPALALVVAVIGLTILASPHFLGKILLLQRRHDLRPPVYLVQVMLGAAAIATVLRRREVNSRLHALFPTSKEVKLAGMTFILSLMLGLAMAEGMARLLHVPFQPQYSPSETALARFDSEIGWSYFPSRSVTQEMGSDHQMIPMYFDDLGCRVAKPGDRADRTAPTALFVGDSFTFGHGLAYEDSFVGRLASMPGLGLHVVNLGGQAFGTDQSLLMLKRQLKKFNTKLVVYTFTTMQIEYNELYDRRIQQPQGLFVGTKPKFALRPDGTLYLAKHALEFKDYSYSHLWAMFQIFELRYGPKPSIQLTRALIHEMKDFAEANGARFVVVDWYDDEGFPWGLNANTIRLSENGPPGWTDWVIPGDGHPDSRANAYVADRIAKELRETLAASK